MLGCYAVLNYPSYSLPDGLPTAHAVARYMAFASAVMALWRPAFALLPILYTTWRKAVDIESTGIDVSPTDYMPVLEVGWILLVAFLSIRLVQIVRVLEPGQKSTLYLWTLIAAIGAHFGNYFYSGVAKLLLDGGASSWVLENNTANIMLASWQAGFLPIAAWPAFAQGVSEVVQDHVVVINALVLAGQLLSVLFIARPALIIALTVFYDLMHLTIYALSGIFFWKWIILNLLIIGAVSKLPLQRFDLPTKVIGVSFTLIGWMFFYCAAWLVRHGVVERYLCRGGRQTGASVQGAKQLLSEQFTHVYSGAFVAVLGWAFFWRRFTRLDQVIFANETPWPLRSRTRAQGTGAGLLEPGGFRSSAS